MLFSMPKHLHKIQNWHELAEQANWSASALAKLCGVSVRTLERHFNMQMGKSPKIWPAEDRQQQATQLSKNGNNVKETAGHIGYHHSSTFCSAFKKHCGSNPRLIKQPHSPAKQKNVAKSKSIVAYC